MVERDNNIEQKRKRMNMMNMMIQKLGEDRNVKLENEDLSKAKYLCRAAMLFIQQEAMDIVDNPRRVDKQEYFGDMPRDYICPAHMAERLPEVCPSLSSLHVQHPLNLNRRKKRVWYLDTPRLTSPQRGQERFEKIPTSITVTAMGKPSQIGNLILTSRSVTSVAAISGCRAVYLYTSYLGRGGRGGKSVRGRLLPIRRISFAGSRCYTPRTIASPQSLSLSVKGE